MERFYFETLGLVLGFFLIQLLAFPVGIRWKHRMMANPTARWVALQDLPPGMQQPMTRMVESVRALGFEFRGYVESSGHVPPITTYLALLANSNLGGGAIVFQAVGAWPISNHVSFSTRFADDFVISTNNNHRLPLPFSHDPQHFASRFPTVRDVQTLYAVHGRIVADQAAGRSPVLTPKGKELERLASEVTRFNRRMVERGYQYFSPSEQAYRLTWKGAYLWSWCYIWPVGPIWNWLATRRAVARLKKMRLSML